MTYTLKARRYIEGVLNGDIPACRQIKLACQRTKDNFDRLRDPKFPYFYFEAQAERVCQIIEMLPHVKGKWAAQGKKIVLEDWQCWIVCELYGWLRKEDNKRKYRRATLIIPRKQGKSLLLAAMLVIHLLFDGEFGAECYCGASNLKQAKEIFSAAQKMLLNSPDIRELTGVEVNAASLVVADTNSKAEPVIGRPKDGANVSFAVCDETHQMKTLDLYESFETGTGAREQPLIVSCSTSGFGTENPCKQLQDQGEKVLDKTVEDEELFVAIWTIDPEIDWKSDLALRMANPNAGVSVTMDFLRAQQRVAINNPAKYASFATKHLDITVGASKAFFSLEKWKACQDTITLDDFDGQPCWLAIDLSNKLDLTAISLVFRKEIEERLHFYVFAECFSPEDSVAANPVYTQWAARNLIHVCDGNIVEKEDLLQRIVELSERFKIQEVCFDPWNSAFIEQDIAKLLPHLKLGEVLQRANYLHTPMHLLNELTFSKRVHHSGDPVLTYGISNVIARRVGRLEQPDKEKTEQKIDPAVAVIMALKRASVAEETKPHKLQMPFFI